MQEEQPDRQWQETSWYAIQAKPRQEHLAAINLRRLDLEIFLPMARVDHWLGKSRAAIKPLFSGYLFARFCPAISLNAAQYAAGVVRVVGGSRFPIPLAPQIISAIQDQIEEDGFIPLAPPSLGPGDRVRIEQGPWQGTIGRIQQEWNDGRRVLLLLEAIHQARLVVQKSWISAA